MPAVKPNRNRLPRTRKPIPNLVRAFAKGRRNLVSRKPPFYTSFHVFRNLLKLAREGHRSAIPQLHTYVAETRMPADKARLINMLFKLPTSAFSQSERLKLKRYIPVLEKEIPLREKDMREHGSNDYAWAVIAIDLGNLRDALDKLKALPQ